MCNPSTHQRLNDQQARVGLCSVSVKPKAHRSSSIWFSKASPAAKWLHPLTLGDVKNGEEAISANPLQKTALEIPVLASFPSIGHIISFKCTSSIDVGTETKGLLVFQSGFPFYRARDPPCGIRRGKKKIPECRRVHAQCLCNHHVQIREFLYILVIRDHLKRQEERNNYIFSHLSAKRISDQLLNHLFFTGHFFL